MFRKWITTKLSRREVLRLGATGAALSLGGLAILSVARATDPVGQTVTSIVGPVPFDEIDTRSHSDDWRVRIATRGLSDVFFTDIRFEPAGHSGWHSNPGPSFFTIKTGTATFYQGDDMERTPHVFPAGTGFVEDADRVYLVRNEEDTDLELVVMQLIPSGATRRVEAERPPWYDFG